MAWFSTEKRQKHLLRTETQNTIYLFMNCFFVLIAVLLLFLLLVLLLVVVFFFVSWRKSRIFHFNFIVYSGKNKNKITLQRNWIL